MRFSAIKEIITAHYNAGDTRTVFSISGSPGCGKSALGDEIAKELGFDNYVNHNYSLVDMPDVAGLALLDGQGEALRFRFQEDMLRLRTGRNLYVIDELPDANMAMQNLGRRIMWNREINGLKLSPETFVLTMGNRSKDKSGAGRLSGKVKNAVTQLEMESNLDDWVEWALANNIDPIEIQFLRFKPNHLDAYDPDVDASPTPRQWELVNRVPATLPTALFMEDVKGKVGEGAAAEYAAFRKIYMELVSFEDIVMNPEKVAIPKDLSAQYAIVGSLAHNVKPETIERVAKFVARIPSDFGVMFWQDSIKKTPTLKTTKPFIEWATSAGNVILN